LLRQLPRLPSTDLYHPSLPPDDHQQAHRQARHHYLHPDHLRRQSQLLRIEIRRLLRQLPRLSPADLHHTSLSYDH
jgi:hypothetical protein